MAVVLGGLLGGVIALTCCTGCGPDLFATIPPAEGDAAPDGDSGMASLDASETSSDADLSSDGAVVGDASSDSMPDAKPDAPPSCDPGDVTHAGKCFYLDGSGGACAQGYAVSSESALAGVLGANANAFQGKTYRASVSQNCCVWTVTATRNHGMASHCNQAGPFGAGEPIWNGNFCQSQTSAVKPGQITLCERSL